MYNRQNIIRSISSSFPTEWHNATKFGGISRICRLLILQLLIVSCSKSVKDYEILKKSPNNKLIEIHWADVKWTEGFWAEKFDLCRREVIPAVYNGFMDPKNSEHIDNLKIAAGIKEGKFHGLDFSDGDSYKWIESLAFMYAVTKDTALDRTMDEWIDAIAGAQMPDGYISTNMQLKGRTPYMATKDGRHAGAYHELYNMGHLLSAAVTHYRATGKDNFLNVAIKLADHLERTLRPGAPELRAMTGNLPNIMGLVDVYRVTGDKRYLAAAQVGVDIRGHMAAKSDFTQDHVPYREENEAVGHSVFATYLHAGVADIIAETGEKELRDAVDRIWQSSALRRSYITGGVCAIPDGVSARGDEVHEAYGADYQLPNRTAYNETCANVGNAMWNWRMLLLTGDAKYADIVETVLFNSMLPALSADGRKFFYANPLMWDFNNEGHTAQFTAERWSISPCYCCPPQIARTIAGLGRWFYSVSDDTLWVHQYGGNSLQTTLPGGQEISVTQESDYPWDGNIKITLNRVPKKALSVMVRIPGWSEAASLRINGQPFESPLLSGTYIELKRKWHKGDVIEINLPMPVRLMEAHPAVEDCRNSVAVMRGPIVYCAEFPVDQNGKQVWENGVFVNENVNLKPEMVEESFGKVIVLKGRALTKTEKDLLVKKSQPETVSQNSANWENTLYHRYIPESINSDAIAEGPLDLMLIPYFARANRGPAYMTVWIPLAHRE